MLNIRDLIIDPASLGAKKLLADITPAYEYKDGRRMETITGYRYIVALPENGLEKIGVKIEGKQLLEKPEGLAEVAVAQKGALYGCQSTITKMDADNQQSVGLRS